ncbi:MAG: ABC transporter substrate-binding protein [Planctomycetota bacterium]|nr:ABC transporter substrate-binding protein [Planctomycetota bacterium]
MLKRMLALLAAALFIAAPRGHSGEGGKGPFTIGFSEYVLGVSWRIQTLEELKYTAGKNPDVKELIVTNANGDISKQIADIEDLVSKRVDAILLAAGSPKALIPAVDKAVDAGIVVVDFDSVTDSNKAFHLTVDQEEFGRLGAEFLVKAMGGKGDIIVFNGIKGTSVSAGRFKGAEDVFKKHPGIKILQTVFGNWEYGVARKSMESLFAAYPKIDGVWSQGGAMSEAVMEAYFERGLMPPPITGEASNGFLRLWKVCLEKDPNFDSVAPSSPTFISGDALKMAIAILKGKKYDRTTYVKVPLITRDNIDEFYNPNLPDSYWVHSNLPADIVAKLFTR